MAHSLLHFSIGLLVGTIFFFIISVRILRAGYKLTGTMGKCIVISYGLGLVAVVPNILNRLGVPSSICSAWWMNIFFMHPLINKVKTGGMLIGEFIITACFIIQYILLLIALQKAKKTK